MNFEKESDKVGLPNRFIRDEKGLETLSEDFLEVGKGIMRKLRSATGSPLWDKNGKSVEGWGIGFSRF